MDERLLNPEIVAAAQKRIRKAQLDNAGEARAEIIRLARSVTKKYKCWVAEGGIKGLERADKKVKDDYKGDWYGLKDLARMTIILPTDAECVTVIEELRRVFHPGEHRSVMEEKHTKEDTDVCGYSGRTLFVRASNGRIGEIQLNVPQIFYAKESKDFVRETLGWNTYSSMWSRFQLEGGLGHKLYVVYRDQPSSADGQRAARTGKLYYAYFRSGLPKLRTRPIILHELKYLKQTYPQIFNH